LDDVVHIVESAVDDRLAQRLEPSHVERDVVVDEEYRASAASPGVGDVGQHAIDAVHMKIPAPHLDDRAEAAVVRTTTRRLDDVDGTAQPRATAYHPRTPLLQPCPLP